jgi:hypothetical protein
MNKSINNILIFISITVVISTVMLGFISWSWADDFGYYNGIKKAGSVIKFMWASYVGWDGRSLSVNTLLSVLLGLIHSAELSGVIWSLFFCGAAYLSFRLWYPNDYKNWAMNVLWGAFILYGIQLHASQSVFWQTGGRYIGDVFFLLVWLFLFLNSFKNKAINVDRYFLLLLITFVSALNGPQISSTMLVGFAVLIFGNNYLFFAEKRFYKIYFPVLFIIIVAALITILAPGNDVRIECSGQKDVIISMSSLLHNFWSTLKFYIRVNIFLFIALPFVLLPFATKFKVDMKVAVDYFKTSFWTIYAIGAMGITSLIPFVVYPAFVSGRTSLVFAFFAAMFLSAHVLLFYNYLFSKLSFLNSHRQNIGAYTHLIVIVFFAVLQLIWIKSSLQVKEQVTARYVYIRQFKNRHIALKIPRYYLSVPQIKAFDDIQNDTSSFINKSIAEFYGLKSISIEDK